MKKPQNETVTFYLNSPEQRIYLVGQKDNQHSFVIEMRQMGGLWFARLELSEGDYRFRYYAGDDRNVAYLGPACAAGSFHDGMDALISIGKPASVDSPFIDPTILRVHLQEQSIALN
jgi:hypothetical protein